MKILLRWSMRILRDNPLHIVFTVLNMVYNYAMLTGAELLVCNRIDLDNTDGAGLLLYVSWIFAGVIFLSSLLIMYNAFLVTIRERRDRYHLLSATGATKRQICGSLYLEALIINLIGAVLGIALGTAVVMIITRLRFFSADSPLTLQRAVRLLTTFTPTNEAYHDGAAYYLTPQRGLYFLLPEMCTVPLAMLMATKTNLPSPGQPRGPRRSGRIKLPDLFVPVRTVFRAGGIINRRMDKRDRGRSHVFLSAFLVSVVSVAILANTIQAFQAVEQQEDQLILRTSGDSADVENALDTYLESDDFRSAAAQAVYFRCYTPRVYCKLRKGQVSRTVQDMLARNSVRRQPYLYPLADDPSGDYLVMPHLLFICDDVFDRLRVQSGADDRTQALLLPGRTVSNKTFAWVDDAANADWTLQFYTSERLLRILDARTRKAAEDQEKQEQEEKEQNDRQKIRTDYSSESAADYLKAAGLTADVQIRVKPFTQEAAETTDFGKLIDSDTALEHGVPMLLFPERAKPVFAPHLTDTDNGLHLTAVPVPGDVGGKALQQALCDVLLDHADGVIAEHIFGMGTRYSKPDGFVSKNTRDSFLTRRIQAVADKPILNACVAPMLEMGDRFAWQFNYKAPNPIYADLYPMRNTHASALFGGLFSSMFNDILRIACMISMALMLFTMFTNCTNIVFAHHMLRRREYAILQSCGMNEHQMRGAVLYEAVWYSVHCMVKALALYLLISPFILTALSYGMHYEHLTTDPRVLTHWSQDVFITFGNAVLNALYNALHLLWLFPLAGLAVFMLFIVINFIVRRRLREDALITLLKKDM